MRHYYAKKVDEYSISQTRECQKYWGTVSIIRFDSKESRDDYCKASPYRIPITYKEARYFGMFEEHEF